MSYNREFMNMPCSILPDIDPSWEEDEVEEEKEGERRPKPAVPDAK